MVPQSTLGENIAVMHCKISLIIQITYDCLKFAEKHALSQPNHDNVIRVAIDFCSMWREVADTTCSVLWPSVPSWRARRGKHRWAGRLISFQPGDNNTN